MCLGIAADSTDFCTSAFVVLFRDIPLHFSAEQMVKLFATSSQFLAEVIMCLAGSGNAKLDIFSFFQRVASSHEFFQLYVT